MAASATTQDTQAKSTNPPLKNYEMWAHFEKIMEKLDEHDIDDLKFEITKVIHDAVKSSRNKLF